MTETRFTLNNSLSNGTSNLNYLLYSENQELIKSLTPALLQEKFGPGIEDCGDRSKGYTDPEWYWEASNGCVFGIGWRWGSPRIRGRSGGRMEDRVHPDTNLAAKFVEFLVEQLAPNAA